MSTPTRAGSAANQKDPEKHIQLRKKTTKELEEMATAIPNKRTTSCESTDEQEPRAPTSCPSETSLNKLNNELTKVPMVKAFNNAESKIDGKK